MALVELNKEICLFGNVLDGVWWGGVGGAVSGNVLWMGIGEVSVVL